MGLMLFVCVCVCVCVCSSVTQRSEMNAIIQLTIFTATLSRTLGLMYSEVYCNHANFFVCFAKGLGNCV